MSPGPLATEAEPSAHHTTRLLCLKKKKKKTTRLLHLHPSAQVKNSRDAPSLSPVARPPGASHPRHRPPPHDCSSLPKALSPTPRGGDSQIGGDARAGGASPRGGPAARRRVHLRGGRVARHAADGDQVRVGGDRSNQIVHG